MKKILRHTWKTIKYNLGSLLLFETGYRILSFFLTMRLVKTAIEISLFKAGIQLSYGRKLRSIYKKSPGRFFFFWGFF